MSNILKFSLFPCLKALDFDLGRVQVSPLIMPPNLELPTPQLGALQPVQPAALQAPSHPVQSVSGGNAEILNDSENESDNYVERKSSGFSRVEASSGRTVQLPKVDVPILPSVIAPSSIPVPYAFCDPLSPVNCDVLRS